MSRYIDAEFEIEHYTSITTHPTPDVTEQDKRNSLIILDALRMAKSIDIVFCKECKYFIDNLTEDATDEMYDACRWDWKRRIPNPDDFCSYGEREGE